MPRLRYMTPVQAGASDGAGVPAPSSQRVTEVHWDHRPGFLAVVAVSTNNMTVELAQRLQSVNLEDMKYLEKLSRTGVKVTLGDGQRLIQNLLFSK